MPQITIPSASVRRGLPTPVIASTPTTVRFHLGGGPAVEPFVVARLVDASPLSTEQAGQQRRLADRWARENPGVRPIDAVRETERRASECRLAGIDRDPGRCTGPFGL